MSTHYLPQAKLAELLAASSSTGEASEVICTGFVGSEMSTAGLSEPRSPQNPKGFFLPPAESVGRYGLQAPQATETQARPRILLGVRACELRARNYLDKVLLDGEFKDTEYAQRREATTTVSCDCVDCEDSCFCTLVGGKPYAEDGYDANLTPVEGGFVVDVANEKGQQWLDKAFGQAAGEAAANQLSERDEIRKGMAERVSKQNQAFSFNASDQANPKLPAEDDEAWQQFAADCVECGACTNICPTCHCFYLYDQALGPDEFERVRNWDSCLLSTYHRMAGGVNMKISPRVKLSSRLANRVSHKFVYSPQQYNLLGCVGCGRCVDACIGEIDIREVVEELGE